MADAADQMINWMDANSTILFNALQALIADKPIGRGASDAFPRTFTDRQNCEQTITHFLNRSQDYEWPAVLNHSIEEVRNSLSEYLCTTMIALNIVKIELPETELAPSEATREKNLPPEASPKHDAISTMTEPEFVDYTLQELASLRKFFDERMDSLEASLGSPGVDTQ